MASFGMLLLATVVTFACGLPTHHDVQVPVVVHVDSMSTVEIDTNATHMATTTTPTASAMMYTTLAAMRAEIAGGGIHHEADVVLESEPEPAVAGGDGVDSSSSEFDDAVDNSSAQEESEEHSDEITAAMSSLHEVRMARLDDVMEPTSEPIAEPETTVSDDVLGGEPEPEPEADVIAADIRDSPHVTVDVSDVSVASGMDEVRPDSSSDLPPDCCDTAASDSVITTLRESVVQIASVVMDDRDESNDTVGDTTRAQSGAEVEAVDDDEVGILPPRDARRDGPFRQLSANEAVIDFKFGNETAELRMIVPDGSGSYVVRAANMVRTAAFNVDEDGDYSLQESSYTRLSDDEMYDYDMRSLTVQAGDVTFELRLRPAEV